MTGPDRIAAMFGRTRAEGRPALIPFVPGDWPEPGATPAIVRAAVEGGADAVEIGVPFSDPLADGVTNQVAYQQALEGGATLTSVLAAVAETRALGVRVPLLLMGYFNPVLAYGVGRFVQDAVAAGVDGLIIVDLSPEEAAELAEPARAAGLHLVYLLAPTSTDERIRLVAGHASGFIYCVSVTGVTGARTALPEELSAFLGRVRSHTALPLAVGFGISSREQVAEVGQLAEAAIVGSAFVQTIAQAPLQDRARVVRSYVEGLTGRGADPTATP